MRKMGSFVYLSCLLSELSSLKCQKWLPFCIFGWWQQKFSHSLDNMCKCIWKILFRSFKQCYGLLGSELPLARCQPLKIQDLGLFWWRSSFFDISILSILRTVTPKPINHTILWKNSIRPFGSTQTFCQNCDWLFLSHQQKMQVMCHF